MRPKWRNYTPKLDVWSTSPSAATPSLGDATRTQVGKYLYLPEQRTVLYDFIIGFGGSGSGGTGAYIVSLPIPAQVSMGGISGNGLNSQHDRGLGTASVSRLFQTYTTAAYANVADTGPLSSNGQRRSMWCQFFIGTQRDSGSDTIPSGASKLKAVTFANTFRVGDMPSAPVAADITVTHTAATTNDPGNTWVSSITTTGFTYNCRADPGASGLAFDWKTRSEVPVVLSDQSPWAWGSFGDTIHGHLHYEPV